MQTISLDKNNNIQLDNYGNISFKVDAEALQQDIVNSLALCQGENPYNIEEGINYDDEVLGEYFGKDYIEEQFINRILENEEVVSIQSLNIELRNNVLNIFSNINSIYGAINV